MSKRLVGKVCLVTGGGSGIGEAICRSFAAEGGVVAVADLDVAGAERVATALQEGGADSVALDMDVTEAHSVDEGVRRTETTFGRLDVVVTAAGVSQFKSITEATPEDFDHVFGVNVKGTWLAIRAAVPALRRAGGGKVIMIASTSGMRGFADQSLYCASKGAIINLTRELALELCGDNINVNAVGPGVTNTPLFDRMDFSLSDPENLQVVLDVIPVRRVAEPREIAAAATFLASEDASYVHGHTLFVDGGYLAK